MLRPYTNVGPSPMVRDTRWETRLLALVAAILVVFGLTAVYGASSLLTISGGQVGSSFALKQALGAAVVPGGPGPARRVALPRADPLDGRVVHAAGGGGPVPRRRAHRPLPHDCRRTNTHPVRRGGERAIPSPPRRHVPDPRERARRGDVAGAPVARRDGRGALVRRRIGPGAAKARLPAVRLFRLHFLDDRRGVGLSRRARTHRAVRHVRLARLPPREVGRRSLWPAARGGTYGDDRDHRGAAHRRNARAPPGHGHHAAVHLVRAVEPVRRPGRDRGVDQHRTRQAGAGRMTVRIADFGMRIGPSARRGV